MGNLLQSLYLLSLAVLFWFGGSHCSQIVEASSKPNIVLILADDLGWADLACYGSDLHESPCIDQLARDGLRFIQAYAPSPVCSPTRASILTGKSPARLHMTIWSEGSLQGPTNRKMLQADSNHDLPHSETTLATYLQNAGYTTGLVGKWHLGGANHAPETHGFDVNIGGTHWGAPTSFFWPYRGVGRFGAEYRYVPHLEYGKPNEYLTDRLTDEAIRFFDQAAHQRKPFFLLLSHHAPHTPIEAKAEHLDHFTHKMRSGLRHRNPTYAAMIKSLDESVGRVMLRLRESDLDKDTIVIFTSDNGGYIGSTNQGNAVMPVTDNAPLRSGKGTLYEGGIRVPLIIRWPAVTHRGTECNVPVILTDLFPTLLTAAGLSHPENVPIDGIDLGPQILDPDLSTERTLFFHYPHYYHAPPSTPVSAIRSGGFKLLEYLEDQRLELFDLREDPSEAINLAQKKPAKAAKLLAQLQRWRINVGANMPRFR